MCKVIATSNQKGGVGKTVSCVNLGIGLAQTGKKVLLIDADPQGSLTISLGYQEPDELEFSLATMMMNIVNDEQLKVDKTILHHKEGVDLIPANIELSAIEVSLVNVMSRELILKAIIEQIKQFYDYIIIDIRKKWMMENAFYSGKNGNPDMRGHEVKNNTVKVPDGVDPELLMKVLSNPDMAVLLTSLAKTMNTNNIEETEPK